MFHMLLLWVKGQLRFVHHYVARKPLCENGRYENSSYKSIIKDRNY